MLFNTVLEHWRLIIGIIILNKNQAMQIKFKDIKQGQKFKFIDENIIRYASQVGRLEIYAPGINQNTIGHSKEGGEEVFLKDDRKIILIENDTDS